MNKPANVKKTRELIRRAFEAQVLASGFGLVEVLSACPTDWGMKPLEATKRVEEELIPILPAGDFQGPERGGPPLMYTDVMMTGFGGQGILLIGNLLAEAALIENY